MVEGIEPARVRAAFGAEMAYYVERSGEGSDPERLADLRRRCAEVLSRGAGREIGVEAMMGAIRFEPFSDAEPALRELRDRGLRVVCVSNWDCSLPDVLARVGLAPLLDGVITSAAAGARKPDPAIFSPALELAGCDRSEALHVGDSPDDVAAAEAAGIEVLLLDRSAGGLHAGERADAGAAVIASLLEIGEHLRR